MGFSPLQSSDRLFSRHIGFLLTVVVSLVAFWKPLDMLIRFSLRNDSASQIPLIPLVGIYLIYSRRRQVFQDVRLAYGAGGVLLLMGMLLYWIAAGYSPVLGTNDSLSAMAFPIVLVWIGIFLFWYGPQAVRAAAFPLAFLFLTVPIPSAVLENSIYILQKGSTDLSQAIFQLLGIPVLRKGFVLYLPSVAIEVAKECSGIRSTLALFITCLLASYLILRSTWKRTIFVLLAFPFAFVKNGIRIVTLCLLATYVNPGFLHGRLHYEGGIVFFLLTLGILAPILFMLHRSENKSHKIRLKERTSGHQEGTAAPI